MREARLENISRPEDVKIFYKLRSHPAYMVVPLKSGCTFFKNLWYYLDHGEPNLLGDYIHDDESGLIKASLEDLNEVINSPYVFMVLRNPVNRFFSLYFDKVVNPYDPAFRWFQKEIGEGLGMKFGPDLTLEEHRANAMLLINWIEKNLETREPRYPDPHWQPQNYRYLQVRDFDPILLPLEEVDTTLPAFLGDEIPNIQEAMNAIGARNKSYKPFSNDEMRNWPLTKAIRRVYEWDFKLHNRAKKNAKIITGQTEDNVDN